MGRVPLVATGVLVVALGVGAIFLYDFVTSLEVEGVADDVYVIRGVGGNVGVLRTRRGAVVVDSMLLRLQGERIRKLAGELAGGPVQLVINTHWHQDHTHGNPGFAPGTRVIATRRTRDYLLFFDADYWEGDAAETLPAELVDERHEVRIGGKTIRTFHPGPAHTGGDLVVLFVEDRVVHTGDLVFHERYPRVDLEAGGSVSGWIAALDRVLELDFERAIPGHGATTDRSGVLAFQRFLGDVLALAERGAAEGWSREETIAAADFDSDAGWEPGGIPPFVSFHREDVVGWAWDEATGAVRPAEVPAATLEEGP